MKEDKIKVIQKRDGCIGCGACASFAPNTWKMNDADGKADLIGGEKEGEETVAQIERSELEKNKQVVDLCPAQIIKIEDYN